MLRGRALLSYPIRLYRLLVSPWMAPRCRFLPTCSEYALVALERHGAGRGSWLAFRRFCRCHPWGGSGIDEVPDVPGANPQARTVVSNPFHSN